MGAKNDDIRCLMDAGVPEVYRLEIKVLLATHHVLRIVRSQMTTVSLATPYIYCKPEISLLQSRYSILTDICSTDKRTIKAKNKSEIWELFIPRSFCPCVILNFYC